MDRYILDSTQAERRSVAAARLPRTAIPTPILLIEFYGDRAEELQARLDALEAELRQHGFGSHFRQATDAATQQRIWKLRTLALGLSMAEKGDAKAISFVEDTAVAPELPARLHRGVAAPSSHGTARRPASMPTPPSAVCTFGRSST